MFVFMPEPPKVSFLQGVSTLFSGSQKEIVDLDAICKFCFLFRMIFHFSCGEAQFCQCS